MVETEAPKQVLREVSQVVEHLSAMNGKVSNPHAHFRVENLTLAEMSFRGALKGPTDVAFVDAGIRSVDRALRNLALDVVRRQRFFARKKRRLFI
jgi:hypothetical protein